MVNLKVPEVITTAIWRRISLNWKWIKEQEGRRWAERYAWSSHTYSRPSRVFGYINPDVPSASIGFRRILPPTARGFLVDKMSQKYLDSICPNPIQWSYLRLPHKAAAFPRFYFAVESMTQMLRVKTSKSFLPFLICSGGEIARATWIL